MKQRQKVNSNRHNLRYTSLYKEDVSDDDGGGGAELLRIYDKRNLPKDANTVEKVVEEGDTLQSLSIQYRCTIAELKRLNNIHRENEIFAKRTIKVPRRAFAVAGVHVSGTSSPREDYDTLRKEGIDSDTLNSKLRSTLTSLPGSSGSCDAANFNEVIFNSNLIDKSTVNDGNVDAESDAEEHVQLLPHHLRNNLQEQPAAVSSWINCSGADADISWIALIICIVVLIFAVPLIYIFYIAEHLDNYHHQHLS